MATGTEPSGTSGAGAAGSVPSGLGGRVTGSDGPVFHQPSESAWTPLAWAP